MHPRSITILSILLSIAIMVSCGQDRRYPLSDEAKQQIALLPAEAGIIGYTNIKRLHNAEFTSSLVDSIKNEITHHEEFEEFIKETGLDPQQDIEEVFFALNPPGEAEEPSGLFLATGNFQPKKIIDFINKKKKRSILEKETYLDYQIYYDDDKQTGFSFVDQSMLVVGNLVRLKSVLDQIKNKSAQLAVDKALLAKIEKLPYNKGSWIIVNAYVLKEQLAKKEIKQLRGLASLNHINFSLDITDKFYFAGQGKFSDTEKAKLFEEAIKGFIATAKLTVSDDRNVIDIINEIDVEAKDTQVNIEFQISEPDAKKLLSKRKKLTKKLI